MMEKKEISSLFKKIFRNPYLINIILMIVVAIVLIWAILFYLNRYTRHNESIKVPDLKGLQIKDAEAILLSEELRYEVIDSIYQNNGVPGAILEQIPKANSNVKEGRTVYLTIQTKNEPSISIPELENASLRQAEAMLKALGFPKPRVKYVASEFLDLVLGVEYKDREVRSGLKLPKSSVLTIVVGDGYGMILDSDSLSEEDDIIIAE